MNFTQPKGQIVLFAPSYSGKSYLTKAFREMGLEAYDLETEGPYGSQTPEVIYASIISFQ